MSNRGPANILPYPVRSLLLTFFWLVFYIFGWSFLFLALLSFIFFLLIFYPVWPELCRYARKLWPAVKFIFCLAKNFLLGSLEVFFRLVLCRYSHRNQGLLKVPLEVDNTAMLIALSLIISSAPGVLWVAYDRENKELLLHLLNLTQKDLDDPRHLIAQHEQLLKELFCD